MVNDRFFKGARNAALMPVPVITDAEMQGTGVQCKVFRIEQMVEAGHASGLGSQHDDASDSHGRSEIGPVITRELAAIKSALERNARELAVLINDEAHDPRGR
jgi:hypothetical protein